MIEAMTHSRLGTTGNITHCSPCNQPHHQFNSLTTRFPNIFDVWNRSGSFRIIDQLVQKLAVPLLIDQPCTWSLQLVGHAARAPNLDIQVFVILIQCSTNCLPQLKTTLPSWYGVLNHVDRKGNHRAGPGCWLATHQRERNGQAMIHIHLIDNCQIKVL